MNNICIIPARGGSKRIPRKNIKEFNDKPIIAYAIKAALESGLFTEVMVSTDDEEIAEVSKIYGAKVPFLRSQKNADDYATTNDVLFEVIQQYKQDFGRSFENACCIYATNPLIQTQRLVEGFNLMVDNKFHTVFPVVSFGYPIWRCLKREISGKTEMKWTEFMNSRSQDLETMYHDAGQWYWFNIEKFSASKKMFTENTASIILNEIEVQDIDNETDWKMAELKYEFLQKTK